MLMLIAIALALAPACNPKAAAAPSTAQPPPTTRATSSQRTPAEIAALSTPSVVSVRTDHSLGTGFVVSGNGLVASNLHVIAGNSKITVTLSDHREDDVVEIFSGDRQHDLAIMR